MIDRCCAHLLVSSKHNQCEQELSSGDDHDMQKLQNTPGIGAFTELLQTTVNVLAL